MTGRYRVALLRVADELENLDMVFERFEKKLKKRDEYEQEDFCSLMGLILHDFYNVLENIFQIIAKDLDESLPQGQSWHKELVDQMCLAIPEVRPAVITKELGEKLADYRSFRHVMHHTYGFQLVWSRMEPLVDGLPVIYQQVKQQIKAFLDFFHQPGQ